MYLTVTNAYGASVTEKSMKACECHWHELV